MIGNIKVLPFSFIFSYCYFHHCYYYYYDVLNINRTHLSVHISAFTIEFDYSKLLNNCIPTTTVFTFLQNPKDDFDTPTRLSICDVVEIWKKVRTRKSVTCSTLQCLETKTLLRCRQHSFERKMTYIRHEKILFNKRKLSKTHFFSFFIFRICFSFSPHLPVHRNTPSLLIFRYFLRPYVYPQITKLFIVSRNMLTYNFMMWKSFMKIIFFIKFSNR